MRLDLLPECLAKADYVLTPIGSSGEVFRLRVAPKTQAIEEVESAIVPNCVLRQPRVVRTKEDGAGEDSFEAVDET